MGKEQRPKRKTTALDRAVLRFRAGKGKGKAFTRIYSGTYPIIYAIARRFQHLFPENSVDDLVQEAYIHISTKVIPKYDPEVAGFKTLVRVAVTNKFRSMLKKIMDTERSPAGMPTITFTEFEISSGDRLFDIPDAKEFIDEILINDFLQLFRRRLSRSSWALYWRLYRDPESDFKQIAEDKGISMMSLYRKCHAIYEFLKTLMESEARDE